MMLRLIAFVALLVSASAQDARTVELRTLCFQYVDDLDKLLLVTGESKATPVKLWTSSFSDPVIVPIKGSTLRFAIEVQGPEGKTEFKTVATAESADSAHQLAVFFPGKGDLPYQVVMIDDSEKEFPMNTTMALNISPEPVRFQIGEHRKDLKQYGRVSIPEPQQLNDRLQANVIISFADDSGRWIPVKNTRWRFNKASRHLGIAYLHPKTGRRTVNTYTDIPPPKADVAP